MKKKNRVTCSPVASLVVGLTLASSSVMAQIKPISDKPRVLSDKPDRTLVMLEYLPESGGVQKAGGLGVYRVSEDGPGFYVQVLSDLDRERPRASGDPARFPEPTRRRFDEVTVLNVGLTSYINRNLTLFGGVGLVNRTPVVEKTDRLNRLSSTGQYFVEDTARRENRIGVQVGLQYTLQSFTVGASYQSELNTPQLSVGFAF